MPCAAQRLQSADRPWCVLEANPKLLLFVHQEGDDFAIRSSRNVEIHWPFVIGCNSDRLVRRRSRTAQRFKPASFSSNAAKPRRPQGCASGLFSARATGQPDPGRVPNQLAAGSGRQLGRHCPHRCDLSETHDCEPFRRRIRRMLRLGGEQVVEQLDRNSTLANGGGDPFARAVANVASSENRGHARLQKEWTTLERPRAGGGKIGSGEDEALFISIDFRRQPLGARVGADHEEESARVHGFLAATPLILKHEMVFPRSHGSDGGTCRR